MEQEQDFIRPRGDSLQSRFHRERARMISGMLGTPFSHNVERLSALYEPYEGVLASGKLRCQFTNSKSLYISFTVIIMFLIQIKITLNSSTGYVDHLYTKECNL